MSFEFASVVTNSPPRVSIHVENLSVQFHAGHPEDEIVSLNEDGNRGDGMKTAFTNHIDTYRAQLGVVMLYKKGLF